MLQKKIIILLLLGILVGGVVVGAYSGPVTSALVVGFSLVKDVVSTATNTLSVGFSLVKDEVFVFSDLIGVGITLIKSSIFTASDTLLVGFSLIKETIAPVTDTLIVGFTLLKSGITTASDSVVVGFTLIKEGIATTFDTIGVGITLIKEGFSATLAEISVIFRLIFGIAPPPPPTDVGFDVIAVSSCPVWINQTAEFSATAGGTDAVPPYTYHWSFGDGDETTGQTVSHIYPAYWRSWHAVVTVTDSAGHTAQNTVKCCIHRIKTDDTISNIDDSAYYALLNALSGEVDGEPINESSVPDFLKFAESITTPYTNIVGNLFFMVFFSAFFLMIWIRQENLAIPSTIGIIVGGYILGFAPPEFRLTAVLFISLSIFGIIYMLLKERN